MKRSGVLSVPANLPATPQEHNTTSPLNNVVLVNTELHSKNIQIKKKKKTNDDDDDE